MASISYPPTLPAPNQPKYELQPIDPVVRTNMEMGSPRNRRRFTSYPTQIPVEWLFTEAEMATFEAWFDQTVNAGESWFNIDLINGLGVTAYEARFVGTGKNPWKAPMQPGNNYLVSSMLEVRARPTLDASHLEVVMTYNPNDITYGSPVLHTFVNATLPSANYW